MSIRLAKIRNCAINKIYPMPKRVPVIRRRGLLLILNFMNCVVPSTIRGIKNMMHIMGGIVFPEYIIANAKREPSTTPVHREQIGNTWPNSFMDLLGSLWQIHRFTVVLPIFSGTLIPMPLLLRVSESICFSSTIILPRRWYLELSYICRLVRAPLGKIIVCMLLLP